MKDLSRIFLNFPTLAGHLWFMYPLISLYLFIPIISPWLRKATAKEERLSLIHIFCSFETQVEQHEKNELRAPAYPLVTIKPCLSNVLQDCRIDCP